MDGEISSLLQASLIMFIVIFAITSVVMFTSTEYGVEGSDELTEMQQMAGNNTYTIGNWTSNTSANVTQNDWSNVFQLTSGTFSILSSMIFALPSVISSMFMLFMKSLMVPIGLSPTYGFGALLVSVIQTLILATFAFAAIQAITKVKL